MLLYIKGRVVNLKHKPFKKMDLRRIPEQFRAIYRRNFNVIKTSIKRGRIVDTYHFVLEDVNIESREILSFVTKIFSEQTRPIKINVSFGLILRNHRTDMLRFFHPSNNNRLFERPIYIEIVDDDAVKRFADKITIEKIDDFTVVNRPSSEWTLERIVCIEFVVTKL